MAPSTSEAAAVVEAERSATALAASGAAVAPVPAGQAPRSVTLKEALLRGSFWTIFGFGMGNLLRLASSLVLTRLLAPDIYGQMAIPQIVMYGLEMFSDIGAGPAIIRDQRGDDPVFLNTAWVMQLIRGTWLWLGACLLAWPLAKGYHQPGLVWLLPAVGFQAAIAGFNSTKLFTAQRHLALGRLTALELARHVISIVVMIAVAMVVHSPWALVAGALTGALLRMVLSHAVLPGVSNRFQFDRQAFGELFHFGKWIFMGSAVFFVSKQTGGLTLAALVPLATLGVFTWATQWADVLTSLLMQLSRNVLLSGFSAIARDRVHDLSRAFYRARLRMDLLFLPATGVLISAGSVPIHLLFPAKWAGAGWMLQLLCVQPATMVCVDPCEQCILALGGTRFIFLAHLARAAWVGLGVPLAWHLGERSEVGGIAGVLVVIATTEVPVCTIYWIVLRRFRVLRLLLEGRSALLLAGGFVVGLGIDRLWESVRPMLGR